MDLDQFETRKRDHLRHALDPAHQASSLSGLERIRLRHEALPDLNFDEIDLSTPFLGSTLGRTLATPFFVAGMTAGHEQAAEINLRLARACQKRGWALGVGSQRRELMNHHSAGVDPWARLRQESPEVFLLANLGVTQLSEASLEAIEALTTRIEASALVLHANALQEAIQPEGTPRFKGALNRIRELKSALKTPLILKETGCGFSPATFKKISEMEFAAVDISGLGGTHWGRIEGARAADQQRAPIRAAAARTFAEWGEPTAEATLNAAEILKPATELWASGGVRSGLDAAKLIALGAVRVGYAMPALEAALQGEKALLDWMEQQEFELKVALFCTGCRNPSELRGNKGLWTQKES